MGPESRQKQITHELAERKTRSRLRRRRSPSCPPEYIRDIVNSFRETIEIIFRVSQPPREETCKSVVSHDARNSIPTFDRAVPSDAHQTIETWLEKIEDFKKLYKWNDVTTSTFMTARLQGLARKWYEILPSVVLTWEKRNAKITEAFKDRTELPARLLKMLDRTKRRDEDMAVYFYDKAALVAACDFSGRNAVQCIAHGAVLSIGSSGKRLDKRFVEIRANGQPLRAYVDLGSEVVTLCTTDADRLELVVRPTTGALRGYGGAIVHPYGTAKMTLKVDLVEAEVDVHVVPDYLQDVPMIIGQPFTDQRNVVVE
ncbi:uncharacterized protein LOC113464961 [Ceratina calcarata]|uniref:Uncharacterized protein LOC113464961 n=1 Tax=Ceratina calcarata TaxID=156304 RepID=A0AAJ7SAH9_9HYME|nr:uncharacterized protein LOC113464961 [Ceratina calcarata]